MHFCHRSLAASCLAVLLSACASYVPLPLEERAPAVVADTAPLDLNRIAALALAGNPDLRVARADARLAHGQAYAAGLFPDPQLALSRDLSTSGGPGLSPARSFGISYDLNALLLHASTSSAARADAVKADLSVQWQAWQARSQARLLFVKQVHGRQALGVLTENADLFADRVRRLQDALARGLVTADTLAPNLTALQDIQQKQADARKQLNQQAHDLNALLGLAPSTELRLDPASALAAPAPEAVNAALASLPLQRPDLAALRAGYTAQDQRYRGALLAQFPAINAGFTSSRDTSAIHSTTLGLTLSLPLLNRNRGNIAIEQATRQKLYEEYQLRLQAARSEIDRLRAEQALSVAELARVDADLMVLDRMQANSELALRINNIDVLMFINARSALLAKRLEQIALRQAIQEQRVALETLLGLDRAAFTKGNTE